MAAADFGDVALGIARDVGQAHIGQPVQADLGPGTGAGKAGGGGNECFFSCVSTPCVNVLDQGVDFKNWAK